MKIFLATPIAGFECEQKLMEYKVDISKFINALRTNHEVWAEADKISSIKDYDTPQYSLQYDLSQIALCDVFLLHYPQKIVTSALFELGIAVAHHKKIVIIVPKRTMLPYLVQGVTEVIENAYIIESMALDNFCVDLVEKCIIS